MPSPSIPAAVSSPAATPAPGSASNAADAASVAQETGGDVPSFHALLAAQFLPSSESDPGAAASPVALLASLNPQETEAAPPATDVGGLLALIMAQLAGGAIEVGETAPGAQQVATTQAPVSDAPMTTGSTPLIALLDRSGKIDQAADSSAEAPPTALESEKFAALIAGADTKLAAETAARTTKSAMPSAAMEPTAPTESAGIGHGTALPRQHSAGDPQPVLHLETAVASPRWSEDLAQKVVWLANRSESRAELVLSPPHMGRIEVSLSVSHGGEANVVFASPSAQVREALEQSLTRLREVFAAAGIALGQASVNPVRHPATSGVTSAARRDTVAGTPRPCLYRSAPRLG